MIDMLEGRTDSGKSLFGFPCASVAHMCPLQPPPAPQHTHTFNLTSYMDGGEEKKTWWELDTMMSCGPNTEAEARVSWNQKFETILSRVTRINPTQLQLE